MGDISPVLTRFLSAASGRGFLLSAITAWVSSLMANEDQGGAGCAVLGAT